MRRRDFMRLGLGALAGSAIGEDALDLLDRLTHKRKYFPGTDFPVPVYSSIDNVWWITRELIDDDRSLHPELQKFINVSGARLEVVSHDIALRRLLVRFKP